LIPSIKKLFLITLLLSINFTSLSYSNHSDTNINWETQSNELTEELNWLKAENYVISASQVLESIKQAAASVTVITGRDIENMGAKNIGDILNTVPGFFSVLGKNGLITMQSRGHLTSRNQRLLFLLNSQPLNRYAHDGGVSYVYDTIPLENIYKIEIIRGPGSALYGANALVGVINLITKTSQDINGTKINVQSGSFGYKSLNALGSIKNLNGYDVIMNANYYQTNGYPFTLEKDNLTVSNGIGDTFQQGFSRIVSPKDKKASLFTSVKNKQLTIESQIDYRSKNGFIGLNEGITSPDNDSENNQYFAALINSTYSFKLSDIDIQLKGYGHYTDFNEKVQILPDGLLITSSNALEYGRRRKMVFQGLKYGTDIRSSFSPINSHLFILGLNVEEQMILDSHYVENLYPNIEGAEDINGSTDIYSLPTYNENYYFKKLGSTPLDFNRTYWALYGENVWDIKDTIRLTSGIRLDNYSDFGESINPRIGLFWEFLKGYDFKLMLGNSFRAPTMQELNIDQANPDLTPETLSMTEVSLGADITKKISSRITIYKSSASDLIELVANPTPGNGPVSMRMNVGNVESQGLEWEGKYLFSPDSYLKLNYTYQDNWNKETKETYKFNTPHRATILYNTSIFRWLNWFTEVSINGDTLDVTETNYLPGYSVVNTSLLWRKFFGNAELRVTIRNLLNKDISYPHLLNTELNEIKGPGRSIDFAVNINIKH
jgi:outer membrane cobalamin receptor